MAKRKKKNLSFVSLFFALTVTITAVYMMATTILLFLGMLPTAVAVFTDQDKEKTAGMTVGAMNFAGVLPMLMKLWEKGHTVDMSLRIIGEPSNMILMFGGAAIGWLIYLNVPPLISVVLKKNGEGKVKAFDEEQKRLIEEWGPEVADDAMKKIIEK